MRLSNLRIREFRNYEQAFLIPAPEGLTVVYGDNGQGKTNLLEAVYYCASLESFRHVPREALIREGATAARIQADGETANSRFSLDVDLPLRGRERLRLNGKPRSARAGFSPLSATVFSPDDLELVKGVPETRRRMLDDLLVALSPRYENTVRAFERALRQRNALLRKIGESPGREDLTVLVIWNNRLALLGEEIASRREEVVTQLAPLVESAYRDVGGAQARTTLKYRRSWHGALADALRQAEGEDFRRKTTTVGPQRDDVELIVEGLAARTQLSQGEQRSLALALRLAGHRLLAERLDDWPLLLLDDVLSELDRSRAEALMKHLPPGQVLLTCTDGLPAGVSPASEIFVVGGCLEGQQRPATQLQ